MEASRRLSLAEAGHPPVNELRIQAVPAGIKGDAPSPERMCAWREEAFALNAQKKVYWVGCAPSGPRAGVKPGEKEATKTS